MSYFTGTLLASPIVRGSSQDKYGTHHSILSVGGYMELDTLIKRNDIPIDINKGLEFDGISCGQRRLGMLVYVHEDNKTYKLYIDKTIWDDLTNIQKVNALGDNNNWVEHKAGFVDERIEITNTNPYYMDGDLNYIGVSGNTISVFLPSNPEIYSEYIITDLRGDAYTTPITINGNGKLINGETEIVIDSNYGSFTLKYSGVFWYIIALYY